MLNIKPYIKTLSLNKARLSHWGLLHWLVLHPGARFPLIIKWLTPSKYLLKYRLHSELSS